MKISPRETFLIIILLSVLLLLFYYFFLLSPAQKRLEDSYLEQIEITAQKKVMDDIIDASRGLSTEMEGYHEEIVTLEQSLLPVINTEAIAMRLQQKFIDANIPFFVSVNTETAELFRTMLPDSTYSPNSMSLVRFNFTVSGSDGFLLTHLDEVGDEPTHVGYDEFIAAVKEIESDYPDSVRIHAINLEESGQGFTLFTVSVDVYAFNLPSRMSTINRDISYIRWDGVDLSTLTLDGEVGIPFERVPELKTEVVRPFAKFPINMDMLLGLQVEPDIDLTVIEDDED